MLEDAAKPSVNRFREPPPPNTRSLPIIVSKKGPALKRPDNDNRVGAHGREHLDKHGNVGGVLVQLQERHPAKRQGGKDHGAHGHPVAVRLAEPRERAQRQRLVGRAVEARGEAKQRARGDVEVGAGARQRGEDEEDVEDVVERRQAGLDGDGDKGRRRAAGAVGGVVAAAAAAALAAAVDPAEPREAAVAAADVEGREHAGDDVGDGGEHGDVDGREAHRLADEQRVAVVAVVGALAEVAVGARVGVGPARFERGRGHDFDADVGEAGDGNRHAMYMIGIWRGHFARADIQDSRKAVEPAVGSVAVVFDGMIPNYNRQNCVSL